MRSLLTSALLGSLLLLARTANVTEGQAAAVPSSSDEDHIGLEDLRHLVRPGTGTCEEPSADAATNLTTSVCYSPPITLRPGQIEDAFYFLESPYPVGQTVGAVRHTSAIVDDTGREVPLNEVYLHHVFGPGDFLVGEGAEHRGSFLHPVLEPPYYTVIPADKYTDRGARLINIHVISTLGVPADKVQPCIECWCTEANGTLSSGKRGGGNCCSEDKCPSALPDTALRTYRLQYNVTYRILDAGAPVTPMYSLMLDAAEGHIEYDVQAQGNPVLSTAGPIDGRCPQTEPLRLLRCLGHQHIGGTQLRLVNAETGDIICSSEATYGTGALDEIGNEGGYLVAMSMAAFPEPITIQPGTMVRIESDYRAEDHYGVMALMFLGLIGFDTSCPGMSRPNASSASFGPDFQHMRATAFGFYQGERFDLGSASEDPSSAMAGSPAAIAADVVAKQDAAEEAAAQEQQTEDSPAQEPEQGPGSGSSRAPLLLVGFWAGAVLIAAAATAAVLLHRRRRIAYAPLSTESTREASV